jgi:hypothetical protein
LENRGENDRIAIFHFRTASAAATNLSLSKEQRVETSQLGSFAPPGLVHARAIAAERIENSWKGSF